jgi:hypothetical protein
VARNLKFVGKTRIIIASWVRLGCSKVCTHPETKITLAGKTMVMEEKIRPKSFVWKIGTGQYRTTTTVFFRNSPAQ